MSHRPNAAEELFDQIAETYEDAFKGNKGLYQALDGLKSYPGSISTVLDVGCGPGGPAAYLAQQRYRVTGIDISQKMVDHCAKHIPGSFLKVSMTEYAPSERFDAVISILSLLQLPYHSIYSMLFKMASWLRPGGIFILGMIDPEEYRGGEAMQGVASDYVEGYTAPFMDTTVTITLITTKGLLSIIQQTGLVIRSVEKHVFMPTTGDQEHHVYITAQKTTQEPLYG
ncbi:S-adenosyl-L-methionine-dependent methyltransferase [Bimuria novae-zelandiae CBS 107.79]|uniref:S-adenosyl-L-methionine-dependent methyltransferase n=1 Tax=Bimuria novae-zelandiae CBS 107.79 TaxID=1447943 RepID=A0A6A5VRG8_9PLEO|nr:S-adenosyl-L-methionine-dependent methyltransferase [Bimuria novae-zelandiae CBS 107.79]